MSDKKVRDNRIVAMHTSGYSNSEIANQVGLSDQTIRRIIKSYDLPICWNSNPNKKERDG